jgi:hypothetical protein
MGRCLVGSMMCVCIHVCVYELMLVYMYGKMSIVLLLDASMFVCVHALRVFVLIITYQRPQTTGVSPYTLLYICIHITSLTNALEHGLVPLWSIYTLLYIHEHIASFTNALEHRLVPLWSIYTLLYIHEHITSLTNALEHGLVPLWSIFRLLWPTLMEVVTRRTTLHLKLSHGLGHVQM